MKRIVYADYLRIIGILGVMGVHLSGDYLSKTILFSNMWYQGLLYSSITRSGALLFIMVSGLLLLDRPQSLDKIPHRLERVLTPFIFWFLMIFLKYAFIDHTIVVTGINDFITQFINCLLNPAVISEEFWYIYMIIGFYLMLPILYKWIKNTDEREIEYFLLLWFIVLVLNYFKCHIMILSYLQLFTGHLGFFVLGYYLNKKESKYTNSLTFAVALFILGTAMTLLSMYIPTVLSHHLDFSYLGSYNLTPGFVFKAAGMFLICKNINYDKLLGKHADNINNKVMKFAEITYGLYLIHILVPIRYIYTVNITPFINVPFLMLVIIIVVAVLLLIMNKIPVLQKFTGMKAPKKTTS